jgi:hypothetical protein
MPMTVNARESVTIERPLLNAGDAARFLGVSYEWLLEHKDELGVIRLGRGEGKGQMLRFDPDTILERAAQLPGKARPE